MSFQSFKSLASFLAATSAIAATSQAQVTFTIDDDGPTIGTPDAWSGVPISSGDILSVSVGAPIMPNMPILLAPAPGIMLASGYTKRRARLSLRREVFPGR